VARQNLSLRKKQSFNKNNTFCKEVSKKCLLEAEAEAEPELLTKVTVSAKRSIIN
jgi:hypothetical protein